jgi:hypothetical protein
MRRIMRCEPMARWMMREGHEVVQSVPLSLALLGIFFSLAHVFSFSSIRRFVYTVDTHVIS